MSKAHQLNRYIVYTCKKCQWQTAILSEWGDLKPKMCKNAKCNCSFIKEPNMLGIKKPIKKKATKKKTKTISSKDFDSKIEAGESVKEHLVVEKSTKKSSKKSSRKKRD